MRRRVSLIVIFSLLISFVSITSVYAKPNRKAALNAYKKYLNKYESQYTQEEFDSMIPNEESYKYCSEFAIIDMNGDKIPELITEHCNGYKDWELNVFTYKNGKITRLSKSGISMSSNMGGYAYPYFCKQKHLHINSYYGQMGTEDTAYKLNKKGKLYNYLKYTEYWYDMDHQDNGTKSYYVNGKKSSYGAYSKLSKNCKELKQSYWRENTKVERSKI